MAEPSDTFDNERMLKEWTEDEGKRLTVYFDSIGIPTIGLGRNLRDVGITEEECLFLWITDRSRAETELDVHAPWWRDKPPNVQRVLLNLCLNMGWLRLTQFARFLAAIKRSDYKAACDELQNSRWWRQVGERGPRMQHRLITPDAPPPNPPLHDPGLPIA